ncbi:MAG: branched-chain amino acid ABC transporter permease [Syntrophomonadaceae bacterium]|jgi:branched-chain amino acid transport system permease protein|nr:branched-chain amino acid ABC transporter permease [Syntrophomonadaceae bacterium]
MSYIKSIINNKAKLFLTLIAAVAIMAMLVPASAGNAFIQNMIIMMLLWAGLASAWNIIGGYAGQLSLGHAGFFGIGAYTVVLLAVKLEVSPWLGLIAAVFLAVVAAVIIGWPCFRLQGPFFALATVAVGEVLRILAINFSDLTYGTNGISVKMEFGLGFMLFREKWAYGIMAIAFLALVLYAVKKLEKSRLGYYLVAIREDQDAARSLGVKASRAKLTAYMISAAFTAIGGVIYAQYILYIDPDSVFASALSMQMVLMTIVGGMGTLWGPVLGAVLMVPLDQFIRAYFGGSVHGLHMVIYAVILILVILVIPRGIGPTLSDWVKKYDKKAESEGDRI